MRIIKIKLKDTQASVEIRSRREGEGNMMTVYRIGYRSTKRDCYI